jgi:hypothetical protein
VIDGVCNMHGKDEKLINFGNETWREGTTWNTQT